MLGRFRWRAARGALFLGFLPLAAPLALGCAPVSPEAMTRDVLTARLSPVYARTRYAVPSARIGAEAAKAYLNEALDQRAATLSLVPAGGHIGEDGRAHRRFQQQMNELEIWGAGVALHGSATEFKSLMGNLHLGDPADSQPTQTASQIAEVARSALGEDATVVDIEVSKRVFYPAHPALHLAWVVDVRGDRGAGEPATSERWLIADADGRVLARLPHLHTYRIDPDARSDLPDRYAPPKSSPEPEPETEAVMKHGYFQASGPGAGPHFPRHWQAHLDASQIDGGFELKGPRHTTQQAQPDDAPPQTVSHDRLSDFPMPDANDAHGNVELVLDALEEWFGYQSVGPKGAAPIHITTIVQSEDYSAAWSSARERLLFGRGGAGFSDFASDPAVVAHEMMHAFTQYHSDLIYWDESGALNESMSDIFGIVADLYVHGEVSVFGMGWRIHEHQVPLRYFCTPAADGRSLDHYDQMAHRETRVRVHYGSGIGNLAFCRATQGLAALAGVAPDEDGKPDPAALKRAARAWLQANESYWTESAPYQEGCQGVVDAAAALGYSDAEVAVLHQAWADVGVHCQMPGA